MKPIDCHLLFESPMLIRLTPTGSASAERDVRHDRHSTREHAMHIKAHPPVFVPAQHRAEIEKLSKAALMDMVWDYALQIAGVDGGHPQAIEEGIAEFRRRREIILIHRNQG